jgi:hypothetical protein
MAEKKSTKKAGKDIVFVIGEKHPKDVPPGCDAIVLPGHFISTGGVFRALARVTEEQLAELGLKRK